MLKEDSLVDPNDDDDDQILSAGSRKARVSEPSPLLATTTTGTEDKNVDKNNRVLSPSAAIRSNTTTTTTTTANNNTTTSTESEHSTATKDEGSSREHYHPPTTAATSVDRIGVSSVDTPTTAATAARSLAQPLKRVPRPTWVKDGLCYHCNLCHTEFGSFWRRHHCRHCGRVFCDQCTRFRSKIPPMDYMEPVRICERCRNLPEARSWQQETEDYNCFVCTKLLDEPKRVFCRCCHRVFCDSCARWWAKFRPSSGFTGDVQQPSQNYFQICSMCSKEHHQKFARIFEWTPDEVSSQCMACSREFHALLCRRHHCRFCGQLFCNECTQWRALIPSLSGGGGNAPGGGNCDVTVPHRICLRCKNAAHPDLILIQQQQ